MENVKHVEHIEAKLPEGTKTQLEVHNVRPFTGLKSFPKLRSDSFGELVFALLLTCFEKAKCVAEGPLEDVFWGFENGPDKIARRITAAGLAQLRKAGYVYYSTPEGVMLSDDALLREGKDKVWIRYSKEFLKLLA